MSQKENIDIPNNIRKEIEEFQKFVLSRAHVLAHSPGLTFSMALSLPSQSLVSQQAHKRYYVTSQENRPFLKWLNKPEVPSACFMTLSGIY